MEHLLIFITILYNILSYILTLPGWDSDNGIIPTDKGNKVSWINSILIQLNFFHVGGVLSRKVPSVFYMFAVCCTGPRTIVADGRV